MNNQIIAQETMTVEIATFLTVTEFTNLLRKKYCQMQYDDFLQMTGFVDSQYSIEKFSAFKDSVRGLLTFDDETLAKILS